MQAIKNVYAASREFAYSVVEFRSSASPLYWMIVNSAFWWSVFYVTKEYQLRLLVSIAACIFAWDVLLSPSHEHSPLTHLLLWPFRETVRSVGTALTLLSADHLKSGRDETACWLAYASLFLFMINPVLKYQRVSQRILEVTVISFHAAKSFIAFIVIRPSSVTYRVIKYIVLFKWTKERRIIFPVTKALSAFKSFLTYWFYAQWWPSLKCWLRRHVGEQLERIFNYICFGLVYVFCFYWFSSFAAFLSRVIIMAMKVVVKYLNIVFSHTKRTALVPFYEWIKQCLNDLLIFNKKMLHKLAIIFKDSVLCPILMMIVSIIKKIAFGIRAALLQPVINWFYKKYKFCEDYVLIHILAPACKLIVNNIPEKSPFCDESDIELADFIPEEEEEGTDTADSFSEAGRARRSISPLSDDEHELMHGLVFPSIEASELSEDEFSVSRKSVPQKKQLKKRRKSSESLSSMSQNANPDTFSSENDTPERSGSSERFTPDIDQIDASTALEENEDTYIVKDDVIDRHFFLEPLGGETERLDNC